MLNLWPTKCAQGVFPTHRPGAMVDEVICSADEDVVQRVKEITGAFNGVGLHVHA